MPSSILKTSEGYYYFLMNESGREVRSEQTILEIDGDAPITK